MLKINDIVKDRSGVLGQVWDIENDGAYLVLFMDTTRDNIPCHCSETPNNEDDYIYIELVTDEKEIEKYNSWDKEYNRLFKLYDETWKEEDRPSHEALESLYNKYQ